MSNSYQLKLTGTSELGQAIDTTKSLRIGLDVDVYSVEKLDDGNGDFTIRYKAKVTSAVDVMQGEKIFKGVDKTKKSQRLRWRLEAKARELGIDTETYYNEQMEKIIGSV